MTANTDQPSDAPAPTLKLGDCVQLVSGGPSMVVEHVRTDGFAGCAWFDKDAEVCRDAFPTGALRLGTALRVVVGRGGSGGSAA